MRIVKSLQVFKDGDACFGMRFEGTLGQQFAFQRREKTFRHRIVETISD